MDDIILEARKQAVLGGLQRISNEVVAFERQQRELAHLQKMLSADADQLQGLANQIDNALTTAKMWTASSKWLLEDHNRLVNLHGRSSRRRRSPNGSASSPSGPTPGSMR